MKIFLGLFTNLDSIITNYDIKKFREIKPVKPSREILSEPGEILYVLKQSCDSEHLINKKLFSFLKRNFEGRKKIGGNAGNSAIILSELGVSSILSCPVRPKSIMDILNGYKWVKLANKTGFKDPIKTIRNDPEFEHLCFEEKNHRHIFTYDPISLEGKLDQYFWENIKLADILWLCGFHLISQKHKKKVDRVSDILKGTGCKVHLELGQGTETIKYAVRKLIDRGVVNSLGMNEPETKFIGFGNGNVMENTEFFTEFMERNGLDRLTIHSKDYRLTFFQKDREKNIKAGEYSVKVSGAKTFGSIKENLDRVERLKRSGIKGIRRRNFVLIPAYQNPKPKVITGLGDTCSVVDAMISLK